MSPVQQARLPKNKHEKQDIAVQGTNDSSVLSKASAATQLYFHDDFQRRFVCKAPRRSPLINRGYYVRWRAVDQCVRQFLQVTAHCGRRQVLSLGAGFDSLYFRLHAEGVLERVVVFELDFPDVSRRKAALIGADPRLTESLIDQNLKPSEITDQLYVSSTQYRLLGVDLRNEKAVEEALIGAGLQWDNPTLLLSEVALTYMETQWSDAVIGWAARVFLQSTFVLYEQIRPLDPFGRVMQDHFLKLNSTLHALTTYPDTTAQTQRFLNKGWDHAVCLDMNQFYLSLIPEQERRRVESLEPFDEFEEWHQKCSHYFILTATRGSMSSQSLICPPLGFPVQQLKLVLEPPDLTVVPVPGKLCVERVGMASVLLGPGLLMLTGGYGRAGRGTAVRVLFGGLGGWRDACVECSSDWGVRLYHTLTAMPGGGLLVFGGRSSPLRPCPTILQIKYETAPASGTDQVKMSVEEMHCLGSAPLPRWRHTAVSLSHAGKACVFIFGGRSEVEPVLGDACFLSLEDKTWLEVLVEGDSPEPRHSHSACAYGGGVVIFGGLGRGANPFGDLFFLKPTSAGFRWEKLQLQHPVVPRYSHTAHVIGQNLVVMGGVWIQAESVPGVAVINLTSGVSAEFRLLYSGPSCYIHSALSWWTLTSQKLPCWEEEETASPLGLTLTSIPSLWT
ncbi:tRNA wybutosine-synthesizing protein 4 isoform X2 [Denticeps clupeoides]|uniref:tRNA wybutosine-synthesizing protein 4 isoform X2 n=1 Tax=Denticeps clupeoides TaxID=299321 RepID=UPI0010A41494|nr:tRNA wybutosine-synthesizing protein 4 isoform X2 [Denticeps clupeoides]